MSRSTVVVFLEKEVRNLATIIFIYCMCRRKFNSTFVFISIRLFTYAYI
jgi:hypothetical protein